MTTTLLKRIQAIKLLLLDVDGVLTSGAVTLLPNGREIVTFNIYDGWGMKAWMHAGFRLAIVSGRGAAAVRHRAKELGVSLVYQNVKDKVRVARGIARRAGITLRETACMGDDVPDLELMREVGLALAPANARKEVRTCVHHITTASGGLGAVREAIEFLLQCKTS